MSGFLYFRSGDSRPINKIGVHQLDLDYILDSNVSLQSRQANGNTPSGAKGLLFGDSNRHDGAIKIDLSQQTWRELPESMGDKNLWIGHWNDAKPRPDDLLREELVNGPTVRLTDEHSWQIPIVCNIAEGQVTNLLPSYLDYDKNGDIVTGSPLEKYKALWEVVSDFAEKQFIADSDGESAITNQDVWEIVVKLLQTNYVVGLPELVMMRALTNNDALSLAVLASCRYDELMQRLDRVQKKSDRVDESGLSISDGNAD